MRALAVFRDGRIVAAGTLAQANGTTRMVAFRLLPTGEIDPGFGAGFGYVLAGPVNSVLGSMVMDRNGNVILAGAYPTATNGEIPVVIRLLPDGSPDAGFAANGTLDGATLNLTTGRATSLLVRPEGTITFTVGGAVDQGYVTNFTAVRLLPTGAPDPSFGGTGVVSIPLGTRAGLGVGAQAVRAGPANTTLVAGTDLTDVGTPRGAVLRLRPDGTLDTRFGGRGITRISRAGDDLRITGMVRDSSGRILLSGSGRPPNSLVVRLRASGARDNRFGNGGLTFPLLGRPPGGNPIFTTFDAIDRMGSRAVLAGSAAGPGLLRRTGAVTTYTGRFALTVSKLQ